MPSPDARRSALRRRRRRLAALVGAASLLGIGGNVPAHAQDEAVRGEDLFGAYQLDARATGVQVRYEVEGMLPGGSPVLDFTMPETLARFASGPSGYGLASLAYPGGLPVNFGSLVAQSGGPSEGIPPYPVMAEAFYPAGPVEADTSQPGGFVQKVVTDDMGVQVNASFPALEGSPVVRIGSLTSASRSAIEGTLAVGRTRVTLGDVAILGGVITIDELVTDLVAAHDGETGSTAGGTTASGVRFLGLDATLTGDGLTLAKAPPSDGPAAGLAALGDLAGPLSDIVGPVQEQLAAVLEQAEPQLDELLAQAGIQLHILEPHDEQVQSGAATRLTTGLSLSISYEGKEQQALVDLINSIPADLKPNIGPIPNPVTFLAENHISGISLGSGVVSALATPPFPALDFPVVDLPIDDVLPFNPGVTDGLAGPGFSTPTAPLPVPSASGSAGDLDTEPTSNAVAGAVPAALVALALLGSPLFGMGSARLADNVLAPASTMCPIGLDEPPAPTRPT